MATGFYADPNASSPSRQPYRPPMLTPEAVQHRHTTLMDALTAADRRGRGHLPYDKVLEVYALFFHTAVGELRDHELASFVSNHAYHGSSGDLVVDCAHSPQSPIFF